MVYEGRSVSAARKRTKSKKLPGRKMAIKLTICLCTLFTTVVFKFVFPEAAAGVRESVLGLIGGNVNYTAAVRTLGEAFGGEKGFFEAIAEAFSYAFKIDSEDVQVSIDSDIDETELYFNGPEPENKISDEEDTVTGTADEPQESTYDMEDTDTLTATSDDTGTDDSSTLNGSQTAFSDIEPPENTSYEKLELPVSGTAPVSGTVTSSFGYREHPSDGQVRFHYGIDIGAEKGSSVNTFAPGTVASVGDSTSYGLYVIVEHEEGLRTLYAHLDSVSVREGQQLSEGESVGLAGETGNATDVCLHFEIIMDGTYVNPEYYILCE
ncbi:MAG: M23 family metallopeptidase [Oscillospiraceae bacterium]